ncbi:SEC-C domain-containing protein [Micromonospora sp. NPDC006766]|uniref:SEC-C domain-containing protein n=1 Tax=Micromonospora sp. NPDC006766 TaxID=3154778 RepID=UPI0033F65528
MIENYGWRDGRLDFQRLPGRHLWDFGEEVRRFAVAVADQSALPETDATYIGGWPSANPYEVQSSDLILTSLLYANRVIVRDPIADWFSLDQYYLERPMASRPGFLREGGRPNVAETRAFLVNVVPGLMALKPLVRAGLIQIVPAARIHRARKGEVESVVESVLSQLRTPFEVTERFHPTDLAQDDNLRGVFVFAGGEREQQLLKAVRAATRYFAREFLVADHVGATYCAPFAFERFLCDRAGAALRQAEARVPELLIASEIPLFHGLSPQVIATIHDDDSFGEFRRQIYEIYGELPSGSQAEQGVYLRDRERVKLQPLLDTAKKEADRGPLSRAGIRYGGHAFGLAAGLAVEAAFPSGGLAAASTTALVEVVKAKLDAKGTASSAPVWTALTKHQRVPARELRAVPQPGNTVEESALDKYWGIPAEPSLNVVVTPGAALLEFAPLSEAEIAQPEGYQEGQYRPCECGSGHKFKFCCQGMLEFEVR